MRICRYLCIFIYSTIPSVLLPDLRACTSLLDHDLIRSINAQFLQESIVGVVAAGEVGLGLGPDEEVSKANEGGSSSQETLDSEGGREVPDIGRPDVQNLILLRDLIMMYIFPIQTKFLSLDKYDAFFLISCS